MSYDTTTGGENIAVIDTATGAFPISAPFSIVAWIKQTTAQWDSTTAADIVVLGNDDTDENDSVRLNRTSALRLNALVVDSGAGNSNGNYTKADNVYEGEWVVVVGTFDGTATTITDKTIYLQNSTDSGTNSTTETVANTAFDCIKIGDRIHSNGNPFNGLVAEVAFFDKVLSAAEIDALQTGTDTGPAPNTVASADCIGYWSLDTDQATHADESGNGGPSLTRNGTGFFDADHPTITSGSTTPHNPFGLPLQGPFGGPLG